MAQQIVIVGVGLGNPATMTQEAIMAVEGCDCLIGAPRLLASFSQLTMAKHALVATEEIVSLMAKQSEEAKITVIVSGDVGFYSGTKKLLAALTGQSVRLIPGISSLVYFCSQLQVPWEDVAVCSVHGRQAPILGTVMTHGRTFLLTGSNATVQDICRLLVQFGMGELQVYVGERLSYAQQRIVSGRAEALAQRVFDDLSVMLVENPIPLVQPMLTAGLADSAFIRGEVPMTKSEVRSVSLAKLRLQRTDVVYDIGAGTGSVAVEIALQVTAGQVFAIERNPAALALIEENKAKFAVHHLTIVAATAPEGLAELPAPDAVFIGGSAGNLVAILDAILAKNPTVRVVITAIMLETVSEALSYLKAHFAEVEIVQLTVAKNKTLQVGTLMMGQNPVFILSGQGAVSHV